jgi:hypothetical protein
MFGSIQKYEILAMNAYKDIRNAEAAVVEKLLPDQKDRAEFMQDMDRLIKDEEKHTNICKKQTQGFAKVMYRIVKY